MSFKTLNRGLPMARWVPTLLKQHDDLPDHVKKGPLLSSFDVLNAQMCWVTATHAFQGTQICQGYFHIFILQIQFHIKFKFNVGFCKYRREGQNVGEWRLGMDRKECSLEHANCLCWMSPELLETPIISAAPEQKS